jgi:cytochrome c
MTRTGWINACVAGIVACALGTAFAKGEVATPDEATAMVKKGVAYIEANGRDKGWAEISNRSGVFNDRDLYRVVYGLDGTVHAHGANEKMIGRDLIDLKDVDGKPFVAERVELGRARPDFRQDCRFTNLVSRKVEPEQMYCERLDETVVCGGVHKN